MWRLRSSSESDSEDEEAESSDEESLPLLLSLALLRLLTLLLRLDFLCRDDEDFELFFDRASDVFLSDPSGAGEDDMPPVVGDVDAAGSCFLRNPKRELAFGFAAGVSSLIIFLHSYVK